MFSRSCPTLTRISSSVRCLFSPLHSRIVYMSSSSSSSSCSRGALIVLEGLDRTGKSTQCSLLVDKLNSLSPSTNSSPPSAVLMRFPDRTSTIGKLIDSYLRSGSDLNDQTIHLLFAANRWESLSTIHSHLDRGTTIIIDRYSYSGIAFSSAKGLSLSWCSNPEIGLPIPDKVLFLTIPMEIALQRGEFGQERYEKKEFQEKVNKQFQQIIQLEKDKGREWEIIEASGSVQEIHEKLLEIVVKVKEQVKGTAIGKME
jgi:dTMP kinase